MKVSSQNDGRLSLAACTSFLCHFRWHH